MDALGMIETHGILAAIEASDVMLKTADVNLISQEKVGGGLVATLITGDVAAVKTAVDAAATAVKKLSNVSLVTTDVIPRPTVMLESIIIDQKNESAKNNGKGLNINSVNQSVQETIQQSVETATIDDKKVTNKIDEAYLLKIISNRINATNYLNGFKINDLRNLARNHVDFNNGKKNYYQLSKENLIKELIKFFDNKE